MKAVIMAGGEGSRLRPITCDIPKPMARLCGRPVVEYILDLLLRHGLQDATLTLKYLPEVITRHFSDEVYRGMPLRFVEETEPLGTAGSVKNAMRGAKDAFLVMSGDALCDYDLSAAIRFHQKSGGAVTMITAKVGDPREYGLVRTGENGVVTGFLEKPGWGQAVCDVANTGIYILEPCCLDLIPDGKPFDFAKDLFPLLMERGEKISAYTAEGYWCDIGDLRSYLTCQQDMLHGRVKCAMPAQVAQGIYTKDTLPREDYQIIPPVYIGERVDIAPGAIIGPDTILDDGALVENNAKLHGSLLLPNAKACRGSAMRRAILGTGATLKHSASLFENAVVGAGALIGAHSSVRPGVLVWPGKTVGENLILSSNVKFDSTRPGLFDDTGIHGEAGDELTPELCARLGAALGSTKQGGKVGVAYAPGGASKMLLYALQSGLMSVGSHVWNFGTAFPAQLSFFTAFCGLGLGIFVDEDRIHVLGQQGLPLPRYLERDIEARFARGEFNRAAASQCREAADMSSIHMIYARQLSAQAGTSFLSHLSVRVECENEFIRDMLEETLCRLGCLAEEGGLLIWISSGGKTCTITEQGRTYAFEQLLALCCQRELSIGHDVAVPYDAPWALGKLEQAYHHKLYRYLSCPADQSDREAREESANEPWVRDGLFMAVRVLGLLNQEGVTLKQAMAEVPEFCVARRQVPCTVSPARLMHALQQELNAQTAKEGVLVKEKEATVYISPSRDGGWLKLMVEAANMETATELCAQMEEKLVKPQLDIMKEKK